MSDADLLERFVRSFQEFDELLANEPVPQELDGGLDDSRWARQKWKPVAIATGPAALAEVYRKLPGRLPPLYESLVLSYRWLDVELGSVVRLLPNPPGPTLQGLLINITADRAFVEVLLPLGLIPFGKACGGSYDPLCFDTKHRNAEGDCPVLRVEHEAVLCDLRLGETRRVTASFRDLVELVIGKADELGGT